MKSVILLLWIKQYAGLEDWIICDCCWNPDYQFCYQSQSYASVVQQNGHYERGARKKTKAVLNGKSSTTVEDPSGYSQTASEDNSVGNTEELQNMGILFIW